MNLCLLADDVFFYYNFINIFFDQIPKTNNKNNVHLTVRGMFFGFNIELDQISKQKKTTKFLGYKISDNFSTHLDE